MRGATVGSEVYRHMMLTLIGCGTLGLGSSDTADNVDSSDSSPPSDADWCDDDLSTAEPAEPDCATALLACGDVITATTEGGYSAWVGDNYTYNACFTNLDRASYAGPERIYVVELGEGQYAEAVLSASCGGMGLSAMRWPRAGSCPTGESTVTVCEGQEGSGTLEVTFGGYSSENRWVVVVDTEGEAPAAFRLVLTCTS